MSRTRTRTRGIVPPVLALALFASPAIAGIVLGGGDRPSYADRADVNVGRIVAVVPREQYVVIEFPFGQWFLPAWGSEIGRYQSLVGRELVFDHDLRPQWDAAIPPGPTSGGG